ncbi:uncharacterized protein LOC135339470 [Halichondria panicea]|uniref:uncharacterized protein LOC135339470 n=1 Tax=Halichondria panicea TaxID=6063 RepID=UPI00312BC44C
MTSENAEVYPGNAAYPNPTFPPNQPPQPAYPGYPPTAPGMTAYDPTKQPMGPGVPAGANPPPYQPPAYPSQQQQPMFAAPQPMAQQQSSNNVVVVSSQPTTVPTTVHVTRNDQSAFIFAIVVTLILFFCGCWWSFACTIPAMVLGSMASSAGSRGDADTEGKYKKISIILTVVAIVTQVVGFIIVVGTVVGVVTSGARAIVSTTSRCTSFSYSSSCFYGG